MQTEFSNSGKSSGTAFLPQSQLAFLRKVNEDESFRAELQSNPLAVMERYGFSFDPSTLPGDVTLPALHEIQGSLEAATDPSQPVRVPFLTVLPQQN